MNGYGRFGWVDIVRFLQPNDEENPAPGLTVCLSEEEKSGPAFAGLLSDEEIPLPAFRWLQSDEIIAIQSVKS